MFSSDLWTTGPSSPRITHPSGYKIGQVPSPSPNASVGSSLLSISIRLTGDQDSRVGGGHWSIEPRRFKVPSFRGNHRYRPPPRRPQQPPLERLRQRLWARPVSDIHTRFGLVQPPRRILTPDVICCRPRAVDLALCSRLPPSQPTSQVGYPCISTYRFVEVDGATRRDGCYCRSGVPHPRSCRGFLVRLGEEGAGDPTQGGDREEWRGQTKGGTRSSRLAGGIFALLYACR